MKNAILFFIILATLCCNTEIYSQTSPVDDFSKFSKQDIPLKGDDTDFDEGIARTPARQSAATAFLYGNYLYIQGWFIQNLYSHINPNGEKLQFAIKATKKREPQNIMVVDQIDSLLTKQEDIQDTLAKAIFKITKLQDVSIKTYTIVFKTSQRDIYYKMASLQLQHLSFKIYLILIDTQRFQIIEEYCLTTI